ncbi:MAG: hypothetical protein GXP24_04610 [Planctomycetes bacterium]|nr:hypothetical protein [Planctomycetota bacterium]
MTRNAKKQHHRIRNQFVGLLTLLSAALLLPGCGGEEVVKLDDYLEELEFDRPLESVKEIKVNTYRIPCAARNQDAAGRNVPPMWVQMKFDLYVIAAEEDEKAVLAGIERHRGMLDDTIITICRRSTIDQLHDNRWATIKSRLLEGIRPLLGEERIRQITLVYSAPWEPI